MLTNARLLPATSLVLLLVSVCVNVLQAGRIKSLLETRATHGARLGELAPVIEGIAMSGARTRVAFDDARPTVIYYFSSACRWCDRNWRGVEALAAASGDRFRFVAVTGERDVRSFVAARGLNFEVIQAVSNDTLRAFGFRGTPHTAVVSSQGLITHEWVGAYDRDHRRQIERLFDVALPALSQ